MDLNAIRQGMQVIGSDGQVVGHVAPGGGLSVTPVGGAGASHVIDPDWVTRIDEHVHLRHSAADLRGRWGAGPAGAAPNPEPGKSKVPMIAIAAVILIGLVLLIMGFAF